MPHYEIKKADDLIDQIISFWDALEEGLRFECLESDLFLINLLLIRF